MCNINYQLSYICIFFLTKYSTIRILQIYAIDLKSFFFYVLLFRLRFDQVYRTPCEIINIDVNVHYP